MGVLEQIEARNKAAKKFEAVVRSMTPEQKWKYTVDTMLRLNPQAKLEHNEIIKTINEMRAVQGNNRASSREGSMRFGLRMPTTALEAIQLADPQVAVIMAGKDTKEQNRLVRKLMKVFPQYRIPRDI